MKTEELDKLIELAKKLQEEPDIGEFDYTYLITDFIEMVERYKDFLGSDD